MRCPREGFLHCLGNPIEETTRLLRAEKETIHPRPLHVLDQRLLEARIERDDTDLAAVVTQRLRDRTAQGFAHAPDLARPMTLW